MAQVRVENRGRDQITLMIDKKRKVVIGSSDDRLSVDPKVPKPEILVELEDWKKLEKRQAVKGMLETGILRVA